MFDDIFTEVTRWDCPCGGSFKASLDDFRYGRTKRCTRGCQVKLEQDRRR